MWTISYWKQLGEEAIKGFVVGAGTVFAGSQLNAFTADWESALGFGLGGAVLAVLYGLGAKNVGTPQTTSMVRQTPDV
jgi:hypothetical protein